MIWKLKKNWILNKPKLKLELKTKIKIVVFASEKLELKINLESFFVKKKTINKTKCKCSAKTILEQARKIKLHS